MELMRPFHPHPTDAGDFLPRGDLVDPSLSQASAAEVSDGGDGGGGDVKVYVVVGRTAEKGIGLIRWTVERFPGKQICIVHVHQPSPLIPTLLGKLPVSQANEEVVAAFRFEERKVMQKLLRKYVTVCATLKVEASVIVSIDKHVPKGIVEMVRRHDIRKLVVGTVPEKLNFLANYSILTWSMLRRMVPCV